MTDTNTAANANALAIRARIKALLGGDFDPWIKSPGQDREAGGRQRRLRRRSRAFHKLPRARRTAA